MEIASINLFSLLISKIYFYFMHMNVCLVRRPEEGVISSGTGINKQL